MSRRNCVDWVVLTLGIVAGYGIMLLNEGTEPESWWHSKLKERLAPRHTLVFEVVGRRACGLDEGVPGWTLLGHEKKGECVTYEMKVFEPGNKTGKPDFVFRHDEHIPAPRMAAAKPIEPVEYAPGLSVIPLTKVEDVGGEDDVKKDLEPVSAAWCYSHKAWGVGPDETTPRCDYVGGRGTRTVTARQEARLRRINSRVIINDPLRDDEFWGF